MRTVADFPRNEAGLVDKYIGTAYDVVLRVYKSIDNVDTVANSITNVNSVAAALSAIQELVDNLTTLKELYNSIEDLKVIADGMTELKAIYDDLAQIEAVYDNLKSKKLIAVVDDVTELAAVDTEYFIFARIYTESTDGTRGFAEYAYSDTATSGVQSTTDTGKWELISTTNTGSLVSNYVEVYFATTKTNSIVPTSVYSAVSSIYVNGLRQYPGYGYTFNTITNTISLADYLESGDEVIIVGTESEYTADLRLSFAPTILARIFGLKTSDVATLATSLDTSNYAVLFDSENETAWYKGLATGTVTSWSTTSSGLSLVTSDGTFVLESAQANTHRGDYEDGVITILNANQTIRYDGYKYYVANGVTVPFTTTGNTASTWATDKAKFVAVGDIALRTELAATTGAELVGLPYGNVKNVVAYYTPEMFVSDPDTVTDWATAINAALTQARTDGVSVVRGGDVYGISSPIFIDNFSTGLLLDLGGLSANSEWAAYSDWKSATALVVVGNKSNGSQVGLNIRLGFAYGRDLATCFQLSGYGAGGSVFFCGRMRNCVIGYQCDSSTSSGSASNLVSGGYWYNGKVGVRIKRGNSTYIAEGHKIQVGFITNMAYGGIQLFNGSQYFQIFGTDVDFNGKYLAELKVDQAPASDIRGSNVTWNGVTYEVIDYYQLTRGNYYILVVDSQETTGGNSTISTSTSTALTDGTTTYVISAVRTPTASQFYFDFIHGFEGSAFARGDADFGYMGGKVGGLQRSSFIHWHNSFDENSNEVNGLWVRNQSSSLSLFDKWSGLSLISWTTTGTTATATLPGQVNVTGIAALNGGAYLSGNRLYGTQVNTTLVSGTSATIKTFSYVGDGPTTSTKEVWNVTLAGPVGLSGIGGTFQVHVGSSGIELKNTSGISYPTLSVSGYALVAVQSAQTTMNVTFMFERKL